VSTRTLLVVCALLGCEQTPAKDPTPPTPTPTPVPQPPPAPLDAATVPKPPAYADEAIPDAERALAKQCMGLVYKDGCRVLRRGRIELSVTIDAAGTQTKVETVKNTVSTDGPLALKCAKDALAAHVFPPPGQITTLVVTLILSDSC
jgi:hypothetical protein